MLRFKAENALNSISAGAPPQTPLGELTALPQTPSWISGGLLLKGGEGRKGERRRGEKGREEGKGKEEEGGEGGKRKRERVDLPEGFSEMTLLDR